MPPPIPSPIIFEGNTFSNILEMQNWLNDKTAADSGVVPDIVMTHVTQASLVAAAEIYVMIKHNDH